jgi:hypothetical protein
MKATVAASAQVSKFCFHGVIPGIKLSYHVSQTQLNVYISLIHLAMLTLLIAWFTSQRKVFNLKMTY